MAINISNVALSDTFDIWRVRTNQAILSLNEATDSGTGNTVVLRDDSGNTTIEFLDSNVITVNTVTSNNLVVNTSIDFTDATFTNTGTIENITVQSGSLSNVQITGADSSINIPTTTVQTLTVTSGVNFSGATVQNIGTIQDGTVEKASLDSVTITRGSAPDYSTANLRTLTVTPVAGDAVANVNFSGANVESLGSVRYIDLDGGQILDANVRFYDNTTTFHVNTIAYFQDYSAIRASTNYWDTQDFFTINTSSATTGSVLYLLDDSDSIAPRSALKVQQRDVAGENVTVGHFIANSGIPLVVANNTANTITVFQNGTVKLTGTLQIDNSGTEADPDYGLDLSGNLKIDRLYPCYSTNTDVYIDYSENNSRGTIIIAGKGKENISGISINDVLELYIDETETSTKGDWALNDPVNNHFLLKGKASATASSIELHYNDSKRLETTSTGVAVSGTISESSSLVLKDDVETLTDSLSLIDKLRGVSYFWKDKQKFDDRKHIGLIAEEVREVIPEAEFNGTVSYTKLVGLLVEGIKELSNKVKELETKIKD